MDNTQKPEGEDIQQQLIQAIIKRKNQIEQMGSIETRGSIAAEKRTGSLLSANLGDNGESLPPMKDQSKPGSMIWDTQIHKLIGSDDNTQDGIQVITEGNTSKAELERDGVVIGTASLLARLRQADMAGERTFELSDDTLVSSYVSNQKGLAVRDSLVIRMPKNQEATKMSPLLGQSPARHISKDMLFGQGNDSGTKLKEEEESVRKTPEQSGEMPNTSTEVGKNRRDGREISVIGKTGQGSFMDSFLLDAKLFDAMKSNQNSQRRNIENDEDLLNDDPINELFKEIEEVEFDMENAELEKFVPEENSIEETIRRSLSQPELKAPINPGPPTGRYHIETICENDEEEHSDDEVSETRKTVFTIRPSQIRDMKRTLPQIEEETSQDQGSNEDRLLFNSTPSKKDSKIGSKPSSKTLLLNSDQQTDDQEKLSDDSQNLELERMKLRQETEALKQRLMEHQQQDIILTERRSFHSDQMDVSQEQSLDSVDELWKKALGKNDSIDEEGSIEDQVIPPAGLEDIVIPVDAKNEMKFTEEPVSESYKQEIEQIRLQTLMEHKKQTNSLISFSFPSSDMWNQANINLKDYQKYFVHQMHLAPSTDQRMAFMTIQSGFGMTDAAGEELGTEYYQELGCIGFYGINSNSEIMISILLLTNCHDVREAFNLTRAKSAFNNPQQYLVPDIQVSQLRNALKKIIKHLMKVKKYKKPAQKQTTPQKQSQTSQINNLLENKNEDSETKHLKNFLLDNADFGLMLLLGKLYFHLSKFRQSIFSLNLAVEKCKRAKSINHSNLSECLLWRIFVSKIFLVNKIRVLKQYQLTKLEQKAEQHLKIQEIKNQTSFMQFIEVPLADANPNLFFDRTEINLSQEIVDLYKDTLVLISEFMAIPKKEQKNTEVVLYVQLKLEIFRQSPLYRKILKMHAGIESSSEVDKGMVTNPGTARNSILQGVGVQTRFTGVTAKHTNSFFKKLSSFDFGSNSRTQSQQQIKYQPVTVQDQPKKRISTIQKLRNQLMGGNEKKNGGNLLGSMMESQYHPNQDSKRPSIDNNHLFSELPSPGLPQNALSSEANERISFLNEQEDMFQEEILDKQGLFQKLQKIVQQIYPHDQYIGCVAQSEIHFWKMRNDYELDFTDFEIPNIRDIQFDDRNSIAPHNRPRLPSVSTSQFTINEEMGLGTKVLRELISQFPKRLLGSVKLWQFFKTMASFTKNDYQNMTNSLDVAEDIQQEFDQPTKQQKNFPSNNLSKKVSKDLDGNTEARLIITLINARSLFDLRDYSICFENLQFEFLKNSKYTCLLYLYGKYIIKANSREETPEAGVVSKKDVRYDHISYIGSGIGAMEECLKSCLPEYQSRINFYIGLAFNDKNCRLLMPMQSIHYWVSANSVNFQTPYQGIAKLRKIKKFLDQHQFFQNILEIIDKSMLDTSQPGVKQADRDELKLRAESYLQVLTTFQEKVDGPSSLLLKSYIYAFTLKNDKKAQKCYRELLFKFPEFIKGYIEYWKYLNLRYKVQKSIANKLFKEAKQQEQEEYIKTVLKQAFEAKEKACRIKSELKSVIHMALTQSNHCVQTTTVEWVNVRILAAKTYIVEKKFNKAIHVLTDLCYVIPPDMLQINADHANIAAYYQLDDQQQMGGITFCNRILDENSFEDQFDNNEQDEEPDGMDHALTKEFHNRIFIDQIQENEMLKDFQENFKYNDTPSIIKHNDSVILKEEGEIQFTNESPQRVIQADEEQDFADRPRETIVSKWDMAEFENQDNVGQTTNRKIIENLKNEEFTRPIEFHLDNDSEVNLRKQSEDEDLGVQFQLTERAHLPPFNLAQSQANGTAKQLHPDRMSELSSKILHPYTARNRVEPIELQKPKGLRAQLQEKLSKKKQNRANHRQGSFTSSGDSRSSVVSRACTLKGSARHSLVPPAQKRRMDRESGHFGNVNQGFQRDIPYEEQENLLFGNAFAEEGISEQRSLFHRRVNSNLTAKYSVFDVHEFQEMLRHPLSKPMGPDPQRVSAFTNFNVCEQDVSKVQLSIFAVNSDVSFLYMIGKICCQAGHNLKLGLQALNDYYLFMWHYSESQYNLRENESLSLKRLRNPLNNSGDPCTPITRIKECVKALLCIGQIYVQLNELELAQKYFIKILEDRETLCKSFECKKQVLLAEEELGKIHKRLVFYEGEEPKEGLGSSMPICIFNQHF